MVEVEKGTRLVCPGCRTGDRLYSVETVLTMYPVRFVAGGMGPEYTGAEADYTDDGSGYRDDIVCRVCDTYLMESDLIPEPVQS